MSRGVKFIGNPEDHTGYGRAGLFMLEAMHSAGVPVLLHSVNFLPQKIELPKHIAAMRTQIPYDSVIIELTPDHFPKYKEPGKKNIGYFFWETDRIPAAWVQACHSMNELWVPCRSNLEACRNAGVRIPIKIIPQATPNPTHNKKVWIPGTDANTYIFYSIFQWTERKNPLCLLRAYWRAFYRGENVMLIIKSYMSSDNLKEIEMIKNIIATTKREMAQKLHVDESALGKVYFVSKILSDDHIERLQNSGHCFVTAARGEGWNIPAAQALLLNRPIISPSYGGVVDFMSEEEYFSVSCDKMIPVFGMPWIKWYESNQNWCDPSELDMARVMREVFDNNIRTVEYSIRDLITIEGVGKAIKQALGGDK